MVPLSHLIQDEFSRRKQLAREAAVGEQALAPLVHGVHQAYDRIVPDLRKLQMRVDRQTLVGFLAAQEGTSGQTSTGLVLRTGAGFRAGSDEGELLRLSVEPNTNMGTGMVFRLTQERGNLRVLVSLQEASSASPSEALTSLLRHLLMNAELPGA